MGNFLLTYKKVRFKKADPLDQSGEVESYLVSSIQDTALSVQVDAQKSKEELRFSNINGKKNEAVEVQHGKTTNIESMIHALKGNIGPGFLAIPNAVKNAGLVLGSAMLFVLGGISIHCMHLLLKCSRKIKERTGKKKMAYAEIAALTFETGPKAVRKFATHAKFIVQLFLCVTQLGFCTVYFVFVAKNTKQVIEHYADFKMNLRVYMGMMLPIAVLLCYIKNLKALAPASTFANIIQFSGICIVFYNVSIDVPNVHTRRFVASPSTWPAYFGTVLYAFEGIGLVMPIENAMKTPEAFPGLTGVLNTSMSLVTLLFFASGFYGYLKYGDDIKGSITLNADPNPLNNYARIAFSFSVLITYSLQFYVAFEIIWSHISMKVSKKFKLFAEYALRTILVTLTFSAAAAIPHLDIAISLIGAVGSTALAVIFPPILDIMINWPNKYGPLKIIFIKDIVLILIGVLGSVTGTYIAIEQAIEM